MTERKKIKVTRQLTMIYESIWPDQWGSTSYADAITEEENITSREAIDMAYFDEGAIVAHDAEIKVEEIDDE